MYLKNQPIVFVLLMVNCGSPAGSATERGEWSNREL